jgi:hypothetical protein
MTTEPSILRKYGLGADISSRDPIGTFLLRLIKNTTFTSSPDDRSLSPTPPPKPQKQCYMCVTGRLEPQVVPFPFRWTSDSDEIGHIITLFQEKMGWDNESCKTLSLLLPMVKDSGQQKPPQLIRPPIPKLLTTPCAFQDLGKN